MTSKLLISSKVKINWNLFSFYVIKNFIHKAINGIRVENLVSYSDHRARFTLERTSPDVIFTSPLTFHFINILSSRDCSSLSSPHFQVVARLGNRIFKFMWCRTQLTILFHAIYCAFKIKIKKNICAYKHELSEKQFSSRLHDMVVCK